MLQCVTPITRTGIDSTVRTLFDFSVQKSDFFSVSVRHIFLFFEEPVCFSHMYVFIVHKQLRVVFSKTTASTSLGIWLGLSLAHVGDPAQVQHINYMVNFEMWTVDSFSPSHIACMQTNLMIQKIILFLEYF